MPKDRKVKQKQFIELLEFPDTTYVTQMQSVVNDWIANVEQHKGTVINVTSSIGSGGWVLFTILYTLREERL